MSNTFHDQVALRFQLYNSLFLTLPFKTVHEAGPLLPLLGRACKAGYEQGKSPAEIIDRFMEDHLEAKDTDKQIEMLFNLIQYIERQVTLFDAVEDASFEGLHDMKGKGTIHGLIDRAETQDRLDTLARRLQDFSVKIVLTAHPTQFYPGNVLGIITDLEQAIRQDDISGVNKMLLQLGKTPFINREKPTPYDEAVSLIWYLENVFYDAVAGLIENLRQRMAVHQHDLLPTNLVRMGFWPGGDRDGNPYVTTEITRQTAKRLRKTVLLCHYRHMREVRRRLTFRGVAEKVWDIERKIYNSIESEQQPLYSSADDLLSDLRAVHQILIDQHDGLFEEYVEGMILRVKIFGFHFATLDIRQDSSAHEETIHQLMDDHVRGVSAGEYANFTEAEKLDLLASLKSNLQEGALEGDIPNDVLGSCHIIREIQQQNGMEGCHRYIISNCGQASQVMEVLAFARMSAFEEEVPLDVVPLFETVEDLQHAPSVLEKLYVHPGYAKHLQTRGNRQTIMLGFSDGTKDGGYITANWAIFRAKEEMTKISRKHGVEAVFFDGRGGPPARGGGNTHNFYASLGSQIEDKEIQLTIQGQTISSKFGTIQAARYNIEQLISAGLENSVFPGDIRELDDEERQLLDRLAEASFQAYSDFKAHPKFLPYLEQMTTLPYYGMTNIGSRPVKRKGNSELRLKDLRAIPFVGSWSQMKQNVPGFYGVGAAIAQMQEEGKLDKVRDLYRQSLFFRALTGNAMMALSKTFFPLTQYLASHPEFSGFWKLIFNEFERTKEMVLYISRQEKLLQDNPAILQSIQLRDEIVLPLLTIQQYALKKVKELEEAGKTNDPLYETYRKMVMRSMFGNINAARNAA